MALVVIVDDQAINLKILSRFARSLSPDVNVYTFESPLEALELIARQPPDLIITDFVMPTMSGEDFIVRCRNISSACDVPIIAITAYEDREYRYRALNAGASDFLLSPFDGREFCTRARNLLALRHYEISLKSRAMLLESELAASIRQHADDVQRREEFLRRVVNTVPALIRATDADGNILFVNSFHDALFSFDRQGSSETELLGEEYGRKHVDLDARVLDSGEAVFGVEESLVDRHGRERVLLTTKAPICNCAGTVDHIVTVSLDITERKRVEHEVRESEERFRSLVEGSVLGIAIERDGVPAFANKTYARIFGYDNPEEILGLESLERLFVPKERNRLKRLRTVDESGQQLSEPREFQCVRKDGSLIWVEMQTQDVTWNGAPALQSTVADVSLRKAYEERLQRQANFDEITGLPNRVLALDRLRTAVVSAARHQLRGGVLFLDLDHFKKINDTWGHATGDQLLRMAADRIRGSVREEDTVARLGGDEFTVILPDIGSASHVEPVIHKILRAFSRPFVLERHEAFVTASIGVSVFPDDSDDPTTLMQNADAAMYLAKEQGRNTFQYFTPELNERATERMRVEGNLMHALDRGELILHFQPIIDVRSHQLVGAEALLRWRNADLGLLPPDRFVPLAEDTGLIIPIGRWILDAACRQLKRWHGSGHSQMTISVNISARQLRGKGLVDAVSQALQGHAVPPHCLELEITEGSLMSDLDKNSATLRALDQLGVRFALDDFGTGYSCLSYLKHLPVDTVKIDKSFIFNVSHDPGDAAVVEAIIAMAHGLGIRVIGEGIETSEQLEFVRFYGCDLAQGFFFSDPLSAEAFGAWSKHWQQLRTPAL
jgi:diguanylate cyclase (GGDEF)-like protein/PAS domain S-box-containing protein